MAGSFDPRPVIARARWTAAKWARGTPAAHEYVMVFDLGSEDFDRLYRLIQREGFRATWGPNPETGKSYTNRYLQVDGYVYWWAPKCINREALDRPEGTLRSPATRGDAEQVEAERAAAEPRQTSLLD